MEAAPEELDNVQKYEKRICQSKRRDSQGIQVSVSHLAWSVACISILNLTQLVNCLMSGRPRESANQHSTAGTGQIILGTWACELVSSSLKQMRTMWNVCRPANLSQMAMWRQSLIAKHMIQRTGPLTSKGGLVGTSQSDE